ADPGPASADGIAAGAAGHRRVAVVPHAVSPAIVLRDRVEHLTDDARVAHPAAEARLADDPDVRRVGRVETTRDGAVEGRPVVEAAVPISDDDRRNSVLYDHLDGLAVDGAPAEELRLIDVRDVEHHQPAVRVQVVEAVAFEAIEIGLFDVAL